VAFSRPSALTVSRRTEKKLFGEQLCEPSPGLDTVNILFRFDKRYRLGDQLQLI